MRPHPIDQLAMGRREILCLVKDLLVLVQEVVVVELVHEAVGNLGHKLLVLNAESLADGPERALGTGVEEIAEMGDIVSTVTLLQVTDHVVAEARGEVRVDVRELADGRGKYSRDRLTVNLGAGLQSLWHV